MIREIQKDAVFVFLQLYNCCVTCKEKPEVAGSTFDRLWGTGWWWDVYGVTENEEWTVDIGEDENVEAYGDVIGDTSESGGRDCGWN